MYFYLETHHVSIICNKLKHLILCWSTKDLTTLNRVIFAMWCFLSLVIYMVVNDFDPFEIYSFAVREKKFAV